MSAKWNAQVFRKNGNTNFGDLLKDEYAVILLQGKNVFGDLIYCYLKVALPDVEKLQAALAGEANFNASDFGTVVAAGKGTPPDEVRAEIALTYPMLDQPKPMHPAVMQPAASVNQKKAWDEY